MSSGSDDASKPGRRLFFSLMAAYNLVRCSQSFRLRKTCHMCYYMYNKCKDGNG